MNKALITAGVLSIAIAIAHSVLGERLVVQPLAALENLPKLGGSRGFMQRVIRFAWHLMSVAFIGLGALVISMSKEPMQYVTALEIISAIFVISSMTVLIGSRGKHFAWPVFAVIAALTWFF
ncbi:MAG TPA: hypothetical protein VM056_02550 [Terriglobales bacterium]|nr:hypothetical protein [Terriglobales bacterium]